MIAYIFIILKVLGLAWVITEMSYIQWFIDPLPNNILKYLLVVLTSCLKCASFWIGLCMGGIWIACIACYIAVCYTKIKKYFEKEKERRFFE